MKILVTNIRKGPDGNRHILLSICSSKNSPSNNNEKQQYGFNATIEKDPFFRLSAPHSLWRLLACAPDAPKKLTRIVAKWELGEKIDFPVTLVELGVHTSPTYPNSKPLWPKTSRVGYRIAPPEAKWATSHLATEAGNTLFPCPFEHYIMEMNSEETVNLSTQINTLTHTMEDFRTVTAPKSTTGTRTATQLSPLDALLYTSLVLSCGDIIERSRVPVERGIAHSFRFSPNAKGHLWSDTVGYRTFQQDTQEKASRPQITHIVKTDVESFYHNISTDFLGYQLESLGVHPRLAAAITGMLGSAGLPVGPSASALLAEAVLSYVDERLLAERVNYIRFNDDYHFFCRSKTECDDVLNALSTSLRAAGGLRIQAKKTYVQDAKKFTDNRLQAHNWWAHKLGLQSFDPIDNYDHIDLQARQEISQKAIEVLFETLEEQNVSVKLVRSAFRTLPADNKAEAIPELIHRIFSIWQLSSDVAFAIRSARIRLNLNIDAAAQIFVDAASRADLSKYDYSLLWMLDAFTRNVGPGHQFWQLLNHVPAQSPAYREALLLADTLPRRNLPFASIWESGWVQRCTARIAGRVMPDHYLAASPYFARNKFDRYLLEASAKSKVQWPMPAQKN